MEEEEEANQKKDTNTLLRAFFFWIVCRLHRKISVRHVRYSITYQKSKCFENSVENIYGDRKMLTVVAILFWLQGARG